jgi:hypothetical protein
MLKRVVTILILFLPLLAGAQSRVLLSELLSTSENSNISGIELRIEAFEQGLKKRIYASDYEFLKTVFAKAQQKFLKHFSPYTNLNEVFSAGKYDCLTATSLFSIVLTDLHFQHRIIETNYHIFLIVPTSKGDILIETTDRFNGFLSDKKEIEKRLGEYRQNAISPSLTASTKLYHAYHFNLYQDVNPNQLAGLLYYNQAVKAFNKREFMSAADLLDKSKGIYESPRVGELAILLVEAALASNLNDDTKRIILDRYKTYWEQRSRLMAVSSL